MRKHIAQHRWTQEERQAFSDGVGRPRAVTIPDKKKKASKSACRNFMRGK